MIKKNNDSPLTSILMLSVSIIAMSMFVLALPALMRAQTEEDSVDLREFVKAYQIAWNTHDPTSVAAFFSENADLVMGNLPGVKGREAIESSWRAYFQRQEPNRQITIHVTSKRLLTPSVAVMNVTTTTGPASGDESLIVRKFRGTWLLQHDDGNWSITSMRGLPTEKDRIELTPTLETAETLRPDIRGFVQSYEDVFDRHDPDALSAFYRDDADIIIRNSPIIHGAQSIRQWWKKYFSQPRPYRVQLIIEEIRMVGDDVALLNFVATGAAIETTAELMPVRKTRATWIIVRENGEWLIAALRVLPSEADRLVRESDQ